MDTDNLSEKAYGIIVHAAQVSDTLKADLGARSLRYASEDDWLRGVQKLIQKIIQEPDEYMDYWNLEEEEGVTASQIQEIAGYLYRRADETLARPFPKRNR